MECPRAFAFTELCFPRNKWAQSRFVQHAVIRNLCAEKAVTELSEKDM